MDAARLVAVTRYALAHARDAESVVAEAWQARALAEAVGGRLGAVATSGVPAGPVRAARLTGVREPREVLWGLLEMLAEAVAALVRVARATDETSVYWSCVEAADAAHEAADQVSALLGRYQPERGEPGARPAPRPP